jgi:predicted GIY-YIG superfamily endonuclease
MATSYLTSPTQNKKTYQQDFVFVLQQHNGTYIVGQANNPAKRIAAINSGQNPLIPEAMTIQRIVGIKDQTEQRTLVSVVRHFCKAYGDDKVICV